jgi:hypothetical protein
VEVVNAFSSERSTPEDVAFLRAAYGRVDNEPVKHALINTIGRVNGPENDQWLTNLARNTNEPSQFRSTAIQRLVRSNTTVADLMRLFEISDSRDTRARIVNALNGRREPEAADKLVEIFRQTTELNTKTQILDLLTRRKDPRVPQLVQEIINK